MSSAQPRKHPRSRQAEQSIAHAQSNPSTANIVTAIADSYAGLSAEIADLKGDMKTVKGDVRKLLDHFGLVSGDTP